MDKIAAAEAIEAFLRALGQDPSGELTGTAQRVADAWIDELLDGYRVNPSDVLRDGAADAGRGDHGPVIVRDLAVTTVCPHHLLPAHGTATVAYIPNRRLVGLGTLAKVVDAYAHRLTLQEHIGESVVKVIRHELEPHAALCILSLTHGCLVGRGERKAGAVVETMAIEGEYRYRQELLMSLRAMARRA
ncbi:MAG: GTP cyclohydrolase I [Polyangiaceae bacterium]